MNQYICYVTGNDVIGYTFMKNVVELANKGATLQEGKVPSLRFPHSAFMVLNTEELMESKPGVRYQIVVEKLTKEQLDELEWPEFKALVKKATGQTGRDRQLLTNQYLKAAFGGDDVQVKEEVK